VCVCVCVCVCVLVWGHVTVTTVVVKSRISLSSTLLRVFVRLRHSRIEPTGIHPRHIKYAQRFHMRSR
jgi:hypothetical protein